MDKMYTKTINGCEVNIGFAGPSNDAKGQALWIILEGFKHRIKTARSMDEGNEIVGEYCV